VQERRLRKLLVEKSSPLVGEVAGGAGRRGHRKSSPLVGEVAGGAGRRGR
jgi:hypothetical protein